VELAEQLPVISAVVVNWNGGTTVLECLRSLAQHPPSVPWEAILVDNGSSDGSVERVRAELPWVRIIANASNRGLAAANNQGLLASGAPFALISNPDVLYQPGAVDALHELLCRRERAAFAFARMRDPDGTLQTTAGDLPSLGEALVGRWLGRRARRGRPVQQSGYWWHGWDHADEARIGHGLEACYLVRRSAIAEIGPQDEQFRLDWEGVEWAARAQDAGWEAWFSPAAEVVHLGGVTLRQVPFRWVVSSHRGMYRYFRARVPLSARPFVATAIGVRAGVKLAAVAIDARGMYERAH
jgi:N-acetylglucosaminyl-diphospho-decaprenol L-rhamnosyltransferase